MWVLCLSFSVAVLDQLTKYLVARHFLPGESVPLVPGFLNLTYVRNTGAAWGLFGGLNGWLAVLSIAMLVMIVTLRHAIIRDVFIQRTALGLMIGGIVGNLLDRVRLLHVIDFIHVHWGPHDFPSFNVADSAICVGVGLYILSSIRRPDNPPGPHAPDAVSSRDNPAAGQPAREP